MSGVMNGALDTVTTPIFGNMSMVILVCVAIVVVALISTVVAIIYILKKDKKSWNLKIRTYVENRDENKIMLKPITIDAKRLRLQNGIIIFLLKKPIQGYNLMPQLTINTVPFEYDIIVAADGSYFSIKGVEDIDVKRKILGVEIMHPATEMDRQDLQQENIDLHKKNIMSKWKMIAKIAGIALACVLLIVALIIWGNNSLQAKKVEAEMAKTNLETINQQLEVTKEMTNVLKAVELLIPEMKELKGTNNLRSITER